MVPRNVVSLMMKFMKSKGLCLNKFEISQRKIFQAEKIRQSLFSF